MKALKLVLVAMACLLIVATPVLAQQSKEDKEHAIALQKLKTPESETFSGAGIGAGLGAGLIILGAGLGFGRIGSSALEGMARQPEVAGNIQVAMIIIAALLEGATFFALLICLNLGGVARW
ncbi:MAG TPA: ATP synthase F0 subunit C [Gemmataceae bacterium]|nr:ATP synthase F0 subunit C [Gemmataceae bacterium]